MRPTLLTFLGQAILILFAIAVILFLAFCIESAIAAKIMELKQRHRANKAIKKAYKELEKSLENALLYNALQETDDSEEI